MATGPIIGTKKEKMPTTSAGVADSASGGEGALGPAAWVMA
jgi:hypothetical protein